MSTHRGFTLLTAVIVASVVLSLGITLLDIAYKQIILASSAKNSQFAFYNADTGLECGLYYDQKLNTFDYNTEPLSGTITCSGQNSTFSATPQGSSPRTTTFNVLCSDGVNKRAVVTLTKASNAATVIFSDGYSSCNANDPRRIERGLKVNY